MKNQVTHKISVRLTPEQKRMLDLIMRITESKTPSQALRYLIDNFDALSL